MIESHLNINGINLPVFFLTQVITEEKFRKMGYFSLLLEKVEELSRQKQVNILLVIARRAVSDLYWKFGFKGFSHFPEYNSKLTKKLLIEDKFIAKVELPRIKAWQNIFSNFKIFFDVDNLEIGDHNINSSAALLISDFPVKVISHNLPEYLKLNIY